MTQQRLTDLNQTDEHNVWTVCGKCNNANNNETTSDMWCGHTSDMEMVK